MPELKVQGFLGSLGEKKGFAYIMDRTVTGRLAHILKSGVLWLYNISTMKNVLKQEETNTSQKN